MFHCTIGEATLRCTGLPGGAIDTRVLDSSGTAIGRLITQPVIFTRNGFVVVTVTWDGTTVVLRLNGVPLGTSVLPLWVTPGGILDSDRTPAHEHPKAAEVCADAIADRARWLQTPRSPRVGRRMKSVREQAAELRGAAIRLAHLRAELEQGTVVAVGYMASELRALLNTSGKQSNPLLLRMAAHSNTPLAIYAMSERSSDNPPPPEDLDDAEVDLQPGLASTYRLSQRQELVDLQDWLSRPYLRLGAAATSSHASAIDIVCAVSDTQGAAHYDVDKPYVLDALEQIGIGDVTAVAKTLTQIAGVTIPLIDHILARVDGETDSGLTAGNTGA
jgi:hypothetical protein